MAYFRTRALEERLDERSGHARMLRQAAQLIGDDIFVLRCPKCIVGIKGAGRGAKFDHGDPCLIEAIGFAVLSPHDKTAHDHWRLYVLRAVGVDEQIADSEFLAALPECGHGSWIICPRHDRKGLYPEAQIACAPDERVHAS